MDRGAVSDELSELEARLSARERALVAARERIAALEQRHRRAAEAADAPTAIEVVHGAKAIQRRFFQIQRDAPGQVRGIEGPPYLEVPDDPDDTVITLLSEGLRYRILYDRRALDLPGRPYGAVLNVGDGRRVRIGDIPTKLVLTDQPIGFLPLRHDPHRPPAAVIVVHDPTLLAALSALFELCWERAVPVSVRSGSDGADPDVLPLLVAGLTDREIAAKIGASHRTVRRRVRELLIRLDAQTRFQAGYRAVERGWLEGNDEERYDRD